MKEKIEKSGIVRLFQIFLTLFVQGLVFFIAAGKLDIPRAWVYFGLSFVFLLVNVFLFTKLAPEVANQRGKFHKGTKAWDKVLSVFYLLSFLALPVTAGLDVGRFQWSELHIYFTFAGVALYILSMIITDWAMITNTHFETTVRIQDDREHKVITGGPYQFIRHPGYFGIILSTFSATLIIGSLYALIPACVILLLLVIRTALEDKTLKNELSGYLDYSHRVRYRLFPGVW